MFPIVSTFGFNISKCAMVGTIIVLFGNREFRQSKADEVSLAHRACIKECISTILFNLLNIDCWITDHCMYLQASDGCELLRWMCIDNLTTSHSHTIQGEGIEASTEMS